MMGKSAVRNARRQRHSYFERLDERCDDIKSYIDSLSDRLTKICGDSEERKAALNYYGDLKNAVSMTEQKIDSQH